MTSAALTRAMPYADSIPVVSGTGRARASAPSPGPDAARVAADLTALMAERIGSAVRLVEPLSPTTAYEVERLLAGRSPEQLYVLQVLLGHAVTAVVQQRRGREGRT